MIQLIVNNSTCRIEGVSVEQLKELRELTAYRISPDAARYSRSYSTKRYLMDKRGSFPTGLLYIVEEAITKNKWRNEKIDTRVKPKKLNLFRINLK